MQRIQYKQETINNLIKVVYGDAVPRFYSTTLVRYIQDAVIPWEKRDQVLSEDELVEALRKFISESFDPYNGSTMGAIPHENDRWSVYSALYGARTADSLMSDQMIGRTVTFTDNKFAFVLDGTKITPHNIYYTDKQLAWARRNAPTQIVKLDDSTFIEVMQDVISTIGEFNMCLPKVLDADASAMIEIANSVSERITAMHLDIDCDDLLANAERIRWCQDNAPDAIKNLPMDEMLTSMEGAWENHLKGLTR